MNIVLKERLIQINKKQASVVEYHKKLRTA